MTRVRDRNPVRLRREELDMQLGELAKKVDGTQVNGSVVKCSTPMLSMIEGGLYPKPKTQEAIAQALGTTRRAMFPMEFDDE